MRHEIQNLYRQVTEQLDTRWSQPLLAMVHFCVALWLNAKRDKLPLRAAMLTYWSSVAVVPTLLLAFALTGAAGLAASPVRDLLYDTLLVVNIQDVRQILDNLLTSTSLRALGAVGVLGVLGIGAQLFFQTERAYNDILYTRPTRGLLHRFFAFYAALTLGPLLLATGFVLTKQLSAQVHLASTPLLSNTASYVLPSLFSAVVFVGAIRFLPSAQLSWRSVLWGGLSSALLFEGAKIGFSAYMDLLGTQDSMVRIYGSLGLLPVFLIWINLLWTIVLLGVEIAYIFENWDVLVAQQERWILDQHLETRRADLFFMLAVLGIVGQRFLDGQAATAAEVVDRALGADDHQVRWTLNTLCSAGMLLRTETGQYVPAVPLDHTQTRDAVIAWRNVTAPQTHQSHPGQTLEAQCMNMLQPLLDQPLSVTLCTGQLPAASGAS